MILREVSKGAGRLPVGGTIVFSKVCGRSRLCVHSFYIVCPPKQTNTNTIIFINTIVITNTITISNIQLNN